MRMTHNNLFEWNPGNGRWYPISRRNIVFRAPAIIQRVLFNTMLQNKTVQVKAKCAKPKLHVLSIDLPGISTIQTALKPFRTMQEIMNVQTSLSVFLKGKELS